MTPRKLHCPECGRFLGRQPWPLEPVRLIAKERDAGPWATVVHCRDHGFIECRPPEWLLRALRLVLGGAAA